MRLFDQPLRQGERVEQARRLPQSRAIVQDLVDIGLPGRAFVARPFPGFEFQHLAEGRLGALDAAG